MCWEAEVIPLLSTVATGRENLLDPILESMGIPVTFDISSSLASTEAQPAQAGPTTSSN
jgi:hypothetical protein